MRDFFRQLRIRGHAQRTRVDAATETREQALHCTRLMDARCLHQCQLGTCFRQRLAHGPPVLDTRLRAVLGGVLMMRWHSGVPTSSTLSAVPRNCSVVATPRSFSEQYGQ